MISAIIKKLSYSFDWLLFGALFFISTAGILTMNSFTEESGLFSKQIIWFCISAVVLFVTSLIDWRFLRRSGSIIFLYISPTKNKVARFYLQSKQFFNFKYFLCLFVLPI